MSGRSPGGGNGNPLLYSCLENPNGQRSPVAPVVHGVTNSWTQLTTNTFTLSVHFHFRLFDGDDSERPSSWAPPDPVPHLHWATHLGWALWAVWSPDKQTDGCCLQVGTQEHGVSENHRIQPSACAGSHCLSDCAHWCYWVRRCFAVHIIWMVYSMELSLNFLRTVITSFW